MCNFFSFVTEPEFHGGQRFYRDWEYRKAHLADGDHDSHSVICRANGLDEDKCNKYEYNPLTGVFAEDGIHSPINDCAQAEEWVRALDFKRVIAPLIIKPIVNPLALPPVAEVTPEHIALLKGWASVWASVRASMWTSVWPNMRESMWTSVWPSTWTNVWSSMKTSVWPSVWASMWAYIGSFFDISFPVDIRPSNKLWEMGLVPSFDGTIWRLHTGRDARVVYEISAVALAGEEAHA